MFLAAQTAAHDAGEADHHGAGAFRADSDERCDGIQCVEEKMRVDLAGQRFEARREQHAGLLLQAYFIAGAVPDLDGDGDAKISRGHGGEQQQAGIAPVGRGEERCRPPNSRPSPWRRSSMATTAPVK